MTSMKLLAKQENAAAKRAWSIGEAGGAWADGSVGSAAKRTVKERIVPFIGSGLTQDEVAAELGCTRGPIVRALKELGAKL